MKLSPGAVQLPLAHLTARVPWHDTDWTGRVCEAPAANIACALLKNIKEKKNVDFEEADHGRPWTELSRERVPPCVFERGGFMRPQAYSIVREHRYAGGWTRSHAHFAKTVHHMPPYSVEATPFRWVSRGDTKKFAAEWGIAYDQSLEDEADKHIQTKKKTDWVQDHRNQLAVLDSFFSSIVPRRSLVFLYAKDMPLLEDRAPGVRVLIGVGFVEHVADPVFWETNGKGPLESILWERGVSHSIRPTFADGFLLPYHQLLAGQAVRDLAPFIAYAPPEYFDEFSYVSERLSHDGAIAALSELARVVDLLPGVADGPWKDVSRWIADRLAEAWTLRGPYPGLGSALAAAGFERGGIVAHRLVDSLPDSSMDPWPALQTAIRDSATNQGPLAGLVGRMARKAWDQLQAESDPSRRKLLKLLARFPLTTAQAKRMFDPKVRLKRDPHATEAAILENPYVLFELDRERDDAIALGTIDRGMFPRDAASRAMLDAEPLGEPVTEAADDRRVRAACVDVLEHAATEGHTLLDEPTLRRRLSTLKLEPLCDPDSTLFDLAATSFPPLLLETPLRGEGRAWQLARLAEAADLILADFEERIGGAQLAVEWEWRSLIDLAIEEPLDEHDHDEQLARTEKATALSVLARSRLSALVGPAGTGKTTMLRALCTQPEIRGRGVLLLAPTGKARVQLGDKVGAEAMTLASHLRRCQRWTKQFGYRTNKSAKKISTYETVIVDEASMLTEEMLAALIDSMEGVERLILCGDHRQLPPIGAGRPFADTVAHLRRLRAHDPPQIGGAGIAELTISRRQRAGGTGTLTGRDDLAIASLFSVDGSAPAADETLARVLSGKSDGTIEIVGWKTEDDLHRALVAHLVADSTLGLKVDDPDSLQRSFGATGSYNGRACFNYGEGAAGAERWQLLSPIRARSGGVTGLNRLVRQTWRKGDAAMAVEAKDVPPPLGSDQILFLDKVMCADNHERQCWNPTTREKNDGDVANGEIGIAAHWQWRQCVKVEFTTQPDVNFTFWTSQLNSDSERWSEVLELAYAITVHKAQGSQFGTTFVVVPNPCPLLSPELLYTALTRQRNRVVLFIQGQPTDLRHLGSPDRSETGRRLTRLFTRPDPFAVRENRFVDGAYVNRTANDELVLSKSEVIVANTFRSLGINYRYEEDLVMDDGTSRLPDFTIRRSGQPTVYWEHLGMLDRNGYRADWEAKLAWYRAHGILPWTEGGGPSGTLVWSTESVGARGIDSRAIEQLAREVFGTPS